MLVTLRGFRVKRNCSNNVGKLMKIFFDNRSPFPVRKAPLISLPPGVSSLSSKI